MTNGSDLLELLEADHHRLLRLLEEGSPNIVAELEAHLVAEDQLLFPEARHSLTDDELLDACLERDRRIEQLLADLANGRGAHEELADLVQAHADVLEHELFPMLRDVLDDDRLEELGAALPTVLAQAPSRAHPHIPDEGPLEVIGDTLAAGVDRLRDRFNGHRGDR